MSDRLTLVVFKDHLSSRTLTVRLAWLRAFGLALLSVIALAVLAASLFLNAYRKTITSGAGMDSRRAEELEKELGEIKASYENMKDQALSRSGGALPGATSAFSSLPAETILEPLPARESLPFRLEPMKAAWKGSTLQIRTAIEYTKDDGGNQQGHFILTARGPQALYGYPEGVFAPAGSTALLKPDAGEFFSVSRYREVKADFGPFAKKEDAQSVELSIFDAKNRLVYFERANVESLGKGVPFASAGPEPTATPKTTPNPKPRPSPRPRPSPTPTLEAETPPAAAPADSAPEASE